MLTFEDAKAMARAVEAALRDRQVTLSHGECLDIVARQFGLKNWNVLAARARQSGSAARRRATALTAWFFQAEHPGDYDHGVDDDVGDARRRAAVIRHAPASGARRRPDPSRAFGTYVQTVSAVPFHGKRLAISADLCCANVTHGATIWARLDGVPGHTLAFDNLKRGPGGWLFGDAAWTTRRIVIDVPVEAMSLYFGFFLKGAGSLWAADFKVEETTAEPTAPPVEWRSDAAAWLTPANLHFSDVMAVQRDGRLTGMI